MGNVDHHVSLDNWNGLTFPIFKVGNLDLGNVYRTPFWIRLGRLDRFVDSACTDSKFEFKFFYPTPLRGWYYKPKKIRIGPRSKVTKFEFLHTKRWEKIQKLNLYLKCFCQLKTNLNFLKIPNHENLPNFWYFDRYASNYQRGLISK